MGSDERLRNGERLKEAWDRIDGEGGVEAMDEFFAVGYVRHSSEGSYDLQGFKAILQALHLGFPDIETSMADVLTDGDRVAYRWVSTGTHLGIYMDVPPTHRRITATGITISRFDSDGRIAEDWASWDKVSVLHSLGIIPIG